MADTAEAGLSEVELKLFRLARAARARVEGADGAAVVDETARTYSAASVALPHLTLSAVQLAVAQAAAAGARSVTAAVVVGSGTGLAAEDLAVVRDLAAAGTAVLRCAADQRILAREVVA
jgi:hypothetical protein